MEHHRESAGKMFEKLYLKANCILLAEERKPPLKVIPPSVLIFYSYHDIGHQVVPQIKQKVLIRPEGIGDCKPVFFTFIIEKPAKLAISRSNHTPKR
jgi:hypothetical protein